MILKSDAKVEQKLILWFGKWHQEFDKFALEHLKVSKLRIWWDPFAQNRKYMKLKLTEELCVIAMKNDEKLEEKMTCHFKNDMTNSTSFDQGTRETISWKTFK